MPRFPLVLRSHLQVTPSWPVNKPFYSLDRADADGFQMKNGGTSQTSAGLFARFDDESSYILEIPPRLVDGFPLGRSIFWRGGEYQPCKQWDRDR